MKQAKLYKKLDNQMVECSACNWRCRISPNQTGICGVRQNIDGDLFLLVYGKPVAVNVDPIEKKPLFHFLPGTQVFSLGTIGCNFGCGFCQNYDISQASKGKSRDLSSFVNQASQDWPPKKIVEYCQKNKIPTIAYTYNEPAIFLEYAYDTAKLAHEAGIKNVFVSNGYLSQEAIEMMDGLLDAINIDLKSFNPDFYQRICRAKLEPVLETIKLVHEKSIWLELTTLIIPGENDSLEELKSIAEFIKSVSVDIPWHVTAFYPTYQMTDHPATSEKILLDAYKIGKEVGLKYVYTGNIANQDHESTFCPKCGELLIKRSGFSVKVAKEFGGKCGKCKEMVSGIWK